MVTVKSTVDRAERAVLSYAVDVHEYLDCGDTAGAAEPHTFIAGRYILPPSAEVIKPSFHKVHLECARAKAEADR